MFWFIWTCNKLRQLLYSIILRRQICVTLYQQQMHTPRMQSIVHANIVSPVCTARATAKHFPSLVLAFAEDPIGNGKTRTAMVWGLWLDIGTMVNECVCLISSMCKIVWMWANISNNNKCGNNAQLMSPTILYRVFWMAIVKCGPFFKSIVLFNID